MSWKSLLFIASLLVVSQIDARRDPDEVDPVIFVKAASTTYQSLINDPLLKKGQIQEFMKRKEFADLSKKDYKIIARSMIDISSASDIQWKVQDTKLLIDDPKIAKQLIEIDFRDYTRKDSRSVYINGKSFELKNIPKVTTYNETKLAEQLKDIEKFLAADGTQASFFFFNHKMMAKLMLDIQFIVFPLAVSEAATEESFEGQGMLGAVSTFYNNNTTNIQKFIERNSIPAAHSGPDL